jgi:hypothetical protein
MKRLAMSEKEREGFFLGEEGSLAEAEEALCMVVVIAKVKGIKFRILPPSLGPRRLTRFGSL